jgi:hypothetical protein
MRRKGLCTLGLMASLGSSLQAGWKITTVSKVEGRQSIETEYYKGDDGYGGAPGLLRPDGAPSHHAGAD